MHGSYGRKVNMPLRSLNGSNKKGLNMTKEEKIEKIMEMQKEMFLLNLETIKDEDLDKLYTQTKLALESLKELKEKNRK